MKPRTAAAPPAPHLAAEHADARDGGLALRGRHLLELLVAPDDGEHVHVLPLVLVDALDLYRCETSTGVNMYYIWIRGSPGMDGLKKCDKVWNLIRTPLMISMSESEPPPHQTTIQIQSGC